jgi:hypothetical protein
MRNKYIPKDIVDATYWEIENQAHKLDKIQKQMDFPTLPRYNQTYWPEKLPSHELVGTHGQIVRDGFTNFLGYTNENWIWIFGSDDQWHEINVIHRARTEATYEVPAVPIPYDGETEIVVPMTRTYTSNPDIMDMAPSDSEIPGASLIRIKKAGYYSINWFVWPDHNPYPGPPDYELIQMYIGLYIGGQKHVFFQRGNGNGPQGGMNTMIPEDAIVPVYLTVRIAPDSPSKNIWFIGNNHYHNDVPSLLHSYADCYLEIHRLGNINTEDKSPLPPIE